MIVSATYCTVRTDRRPDGDSRVSSATALVDNEENMAEQERAIRTRRAILEAAAMVFDEQGYDAANISEILARAGVTKGALYFHFSSKEALAEAVMLEQSEKLPEALAGSPLQSVIDLTRHVGHELRKNPMMRAGIRLATEQGAFRHRGAPAYLDWITIIQRHLEQAKTRGEVLAHVSSRETAEFIVGSFTGLQMLSQELTEHEDIQRRIAVLWRYLLPHIATPETLPHLSWTHTDTEIQAARSALCEHLSAQSVRPQPGKSPA